METIKFAKIDWLKTKSQAKIMILYILIATVMGIYMDWSLWSLYFIAFGATILSTTPYFIDTTSSIVFINLLPAKVSSRVYGRYLFGLLFNIVTILAGELSVLGNYLFTKKVPAYLFESTLVIIAVSLLFNAFQFLMFSFIKVKNQQLLTLIRMIPPFIMFFGGNYVMNLFMNNPEKGAQMISEIYRYCMNNRLPLSIALLLIAILINVLFANITGIILQRRES